MGGGSLKKKSRRTSPDLAPRVPTAVAAAVHHKSSYRRRAAFSSALIVFLVLIVAYAAWTKSVALTSRSSLPQFYSFDIVNEFPHDPDAFTQGLLYGGNDTLFESTGLYQRSSVREVHLQTGKVLRRYEMDGALFGEGLTLLGERLFQVTWLKKTGFIYDRYNLSEFENFSHQMNDGWGLATDGNVIFGSDGSSTLYQLDPVTLKVIRRSFVRYNNRDVLFLNELEYVSGEVWANIWNTDCIARISHTDGKVLGWVLLHELRQGLLRSGHTDIDVLNGIAWDEENNRLFVTGKLWPKVYEIKLRPVMGPSNGDIEKLCPLRNYY